MKRAKKDIQIFVTGGTGFVGSYLLRTLVADGYTKIRALRRSNSRMDLVQTIVDEVEWVEGDVLDIPFLEDAMKGVQQVYHCAAMISFDSRKFSQMRKVNIEGTANVVNAALYEGVEKFVHVSSIAAIGRAKSGMQITEKTKWERSKNNSQYSISKYQAEQEVWRGRAEGLRVAIVNPSVIMGAGFWSDGPLQFFKLVWNKFPFYTLGTTGVVDVRDVARFMVVLMESEVEGERFILNSSSVTYQEIMTIIAKNMDRRPPYWRVTPVIQGLSWRLEWLKSRLFGGQAFITKETARMTAQSYFYDNQKSCEQFNFEYIPVEKTLAESAHLFQQAVEKEFQPMLLPIT